MRVSRATTQPATSDVTSGSTRYIYRGERTAVGFSEVLDPPRRGSSTTLSKPNLLIVMHDDVTLLVQHILEGQGYSILSTKRLEEAISLIARMDIDLIILDADLIGTQDELDACLNNTTRNPIKPPSVLLAVDGSLPQRKVHLSTCRVAEILQKPLSPNQLISRVRSLLRNDVCIQPDYLSFGDVEVDLQTFRAFRNGRRVRAGLTEFRLLCHLLRGSPRVISRQELIEAAWPRQVFVEPRTVDVHVGRLRRELNRHGGPNLIRTVRSAGYAFDLNN
jgi:two-component system phosphate regulon response regulator PhoB